MNAPNFIPPAAEAAHQRLNRAIESLEVLVKAGKLKDAVHMGTLVNALHEANRRMDRAADQLKVILTVNG